MNDIRFLAILRQKAGGWEALAEPVDLTVWDETHKKVVQSAESVYAEILAELSRDNKAAQRPAPVAAKGRRAIISEGVRKG